MLGKTHATIGIVAGLAVMQPHDVPSLVLGGTIAMAGALFPDLDSENSMAQKGIRKIIELVVYVGAVISGIFWLSTQDQIDIQMQVPSISSVTPLNLIGAIMLLTYGIWSMHQKHRGVTHSILAMIIATLFTWLAIGRYAEYFCIGYTSHLLLDMLNYQGIQLLYPLKKKYSLKLCKSNGTVNTALLVLGTITILELSAYLLTGQVIA